jgi:hypothetical protein
MASAVATVCVGLCAAVELRPEAAVATGAGWVALAEAVGKLPAEVGAGAGVAVAAATTGADVGALVALGPHAASTRHKPEAAMTPEMIRIGG